MMMGGFKVRLAELKKPSDPLDFLNVTKKDGGPGGGKKSGDSTNGNRLYDSIYCKRTPRVVRAREAGAASKSGAWVDRTPHSSARGD